MRTLTVIAVLFSLALPAAAGEKTIYGGDSRHDFYEVTDGVERAAMTAAVSIFRDTALSEGTLSYAVGGRPFGHESRAICPGERFFEQRSAAFCSGTLIAPDLVLTAGHCMGEKNKPASRCERARFVFGFSVDREGRSPSSVRKSDVYSCAEVKIYANGAGGDYAVVRLDRRVGRRTAARLHVSGPPEAGLPVFTVGGPYGLPLKVVNDAGVRSVSGDKKFFRTNLDTSGGNSGGGIFSALNGRLIGVHTASWDPDLVEVSLPPGHGLPADDARVKAGKCKLITALAQDDGNGKKGYALSAIPGLAALLRGGDKEVPTDMPPVTDIPAARADLSDFGSFQ
ncbi:MAG: hypothetical protein A2X31_00915 [Elusimicrobia bacterium GWB2_63_22]|nr:MAG: hypothetical protein A2X31_00915 [Elusimicrobia bacterium GWB2_63_22]